MKLRDYQRAMKDANLECFGNGNRRTLNVAATGTGKTVVFAHLAREMSNRGRVLVLCHEKELIAQSEHKLRNVTTDAIGVEQGARRVDTRSMFVPNIIVASVPSMVSGRCDWRRMNKYRPKDFGLVVADECHFAATQTWRSVLEYFRSGNPDICVTGFTATPDRRDEKKITGLFPHLAYQYECLDAINDGWLVRPRWSHVPIYDVSVVPLRSGANDFTEADVANLVNESARVAATVQKTAELCEGRKTIFFCVDVAHATMVEDCYKRIQDSRVGDAAMVTGKTPDERRAQIMRGFRSGAIQTLIVVGIGNYGLDVPDIGCVVLGRPSASRPRVSQNIGRGTRPLTGLVDGLDTPEERIEAIARSSKPDLLILDYCFNSANLVTPMEAFLPSEADAVVELAKRKVRESNESVDILQAMSQANKEIAEEARLRRLGQGVRLDVSAVHEWIPVDPFAALGLEPRRIAAWSKGRKVTKKMADVLARQGVKNAADMPMDHGKQLIDELMKYPTPKQVKWLKRVHVDPRSVTRKQANSIMGQIADMRWRIPRNWRPAIRQDEPQVAEAPF